MQNDTSSLSEWYTKIIREAELADYGPVGGCLVIRPYGYAIWRQINKLLDEELLKTNHQMAYFPLLIPESFIEDETKYVEGLSPRVLTVTKASGIELSEPLVIRPTSETIVSYMFSKWIDSYRDLPLKLYQWVNIARSEPRTRPFIKQTEILWLEGHTAHATHEEAIHEIDLIAQIFCHFFYNYLSIPIIYGAEPQGRKFAGSLNTYTIEALMPNGRALQLAAIYDLGQKFSSAFGVSFRDRDNNVKQCWTTNWGLGIRLIGSMILVHGDQRGLRLPPEVAPIQVVILPVHNRYGTEESAIYLTCDKICKELLDLGVRAKVEDKYYLNLGRAISHWETKGIPICIVVGVKEFDSEQVLVLRRDKVVGENRLRIPFALLGTYVLNLLNEIQSNLHEQALSNQMGNMVFIDDYKELEKQLNANGVIAKWCGTKECEQAIREELGDIIRCIIYDGLEQPKEGVCFKCGAKSKNLVLFAKGY